MNTAMYFHQMLCCIIPLVGKVLLIWSFSNGRVYFYYCVIFLIEIKYLLPLHWRHNGRNGVSNHQPHDCLLNGLFRQRSKKTSKLRLNGLCEGNSQGTGEFPAQRASNAENISIWWRHHVKVTSGVDVDHVSNHATARPPRWHWLLFKCLTCKYTPWYIKISTSWFNLLPLNLKMNLSYLTKRIAG